MRGKTNRRNLPAWMQRHPVAARVYAAGFLVTMPAWVPVVALWDFRGDIAEAAGQASHTAFFKWRG